MALGVAGGYFLGRTKKMKLALMLAGIAAGRQVGSPGELLKDGTKLLTGTPELARLTEQVRGRLLEAGKSAALAVATRQVESLTDRVGRRVESLGDVGLPRQRRSADEPAEEPEAPEEYAEDEGFADEGRDEAAAGEAPAEREAPIARRRPTRTRAATTPARRGGDGASATATVRRATGGAARTAGSAGKPAAGRRTARTPRTRRSEGDG